MFSWSSRATQDRKSVSGMLLPTHKSGKQHLSQPRGQHSVGFIDVMTPGEPEIGTFMRLYYPTDAQCLEEHDRWPIWTFEDKYISGIYTFMKSMVHRWPSWAPRKEFMWYERVQHLIKLMPYFGFNTAFKYLFGQVYIPIIENAAVKKDGSSAKWPIVVFSHGIGCSRFMYSQICYDIASYGFIVAATEHREGSACMSRYYSDGGSNQERIVNWIDHKRCEKDENEYAFRNRQVHMRSKEVSRTLDILLDLQSGKEVQNIFTKENASFNTTQSHPFNLSQFRDSMDVTQPVIAGHSFGGATTILVLAEDTRFKLGLALDAWLFPVRDINLSSSVKQPVLFINTESFLNTRNLTKMSTFENVTPNSGERKSCYIIGTVHQNHLDLPFLLQQTMIKRFLGLHSLTCPELVMNLNNKLMVQFLYKHLGVNADAEIDDEILKNSSLIKEGFGISDDVPTTDW